MSRAVAAHRADSVRKPSWGGQSMMTTSYRSSTDASAWATRAKNKASHKLDVARDKIKSGVIGWPHDLTQVSAVPVIVADSSIEGFVLADIELRLIAVQCR